MNRYEHLGRVQRFMNMDKPMPLLLIEDDVAECRRFRDYANSEAGVTFIGMTGSSIEGLKRVQARLPEGVILDLELHKGEGSGIQFLTDLKKMNLAFKPIIIVTTSSISDIVYEHIRDLGVDCIFCKRQKDYSPSMVINTLLALRKLLRLRQRNNVPDDLQTIESPEELHDRITQRIDTELNTVGISVRYKGRTYLNEAILHLIYNGTNNNSEAVLYQVSKQHHVTYSSVFRAIQTAINKAWDTTSYDELINNYPMRINHNTGVPSPTEFIYNYAEKIRKSM